MIFGLYSTVGWVKMNYDSFKPGDYPVGGKKGSVKWHCRQTETHDHLFFEMRSPTLAPYPHGTLNIKKNGAAVTARVFC